MSRLFPERITVAVAPDQLMVGSRTISCDAAFGSEPWHGAIAALRGVEWKDRVRVTAVLSNHFVRYALVPWNTALADPAEEEAYVRHHFTKIHGERAKSWRLRWSAESADAPRLASAIDAALIDAIGAAFPKGGEAKLVSVQPLLMHVFNRTRAAVPASGAWLVVAEAQRACVALHAAGAFRAVQNARGEWRTLLERERHRMADATPALALLDGAAPPSHDSYWQFSKATT